MNAIYQVYSESGKLYNINSLKYGIKQGMILLLQNDQFYTCNGSESIIAKSDYDCTGTVKLKPIYYLDINI
jgi:hypothetical protein